MKRLRLASLLMLLPLGFILAAILFLTVTESGLRFLVHSGVRFAGGALSVEKIQGRLLDHWQVNGVRLQTADVDITLRQLQGQWQPWNLLRGAVRLVSLHGSGADVRVKAGEQGAPVWTPPVRLLFPVAVILDGVELENLIITDVSGMVWPVIQRASLTGEIQKGKLIVRGLDAVMAGVGAHLQGSLAMADGWPLDFHGNWRIDESLAGKDIGPVAADMVICGTLEKPLATMDLQTPMAGRLTLAVTDPYGDLRWQADSQFSGGALLEKFFGKPDVHLEKVALQASGTLDEYRGNFRMDGGGENWPAVRVEGELSGDGNGLTVSTLHASAEKDGRKFGALEGTGALKWQEGWQWQVELRGLQIDSGLIFPQWQGLVDARVTSVGSLHKNVLQSETEIASLEGELLGHPLSGQGLLQVDGKTMTVKDVRLQSGSSQIRVNGSLADTLYLRFEADIADLGDFLPDSSGSVSAQLDLNGNPKAPQLVLDFQASDLAYQDIHLQELLGSGKGDLDPQGAVELHVNGRNLHLQEHLFSELHMELTGTTAFHQLGMSTQAEEGTLNLKIAGNLQGQQWQAELSKAQLALENYGKWELSQPTSLRVGTGGIDLGKLCLQQEKSALCVEGGWQTDGEQWRVMADIDSLTGGQAYRWRLFPRPVEGVLTASLQARGSGRHLDSGRVQLTVPELMLALQDEDGKEQRLFWRENKVVLEAENGRLVSSFRTRFQEESALDASLVVTDFGDLAASWETLPVQGEVNVDIRNLRPLAVLTDYSVIPTGAMAGALKVHGLLGNPRLSGELRQTSGDIAVPMLGVSLEDLLLSARLRGDGEGMSLSLDLKSGPGSARVVADVGHGKQGWEIESKINGENFELANTAGYDVQIDPDLVVALRGGALQVGGRIRVPHAVIVGKAMNQSVSASPDIIFIDGKEEKRIHWPVSGTVDVELGDDVSVDAFDVKGAVHGSLVITAVPGHPLVGQGNLTLQDAIYRMRERALGISRGRFFFAGGPLDNPGIDLLAQTRSRNRTVGVLVSGTVQDMELKLFSDPPMPENAILMELLAGRSFSETGHRVSSTVDALASGIGLERGGSFFKGLLGPLEDRLSLNNIYVESDGNFTNTSVMIGKNLFEDLYISYGYDPVRSTGLFRVNYNLWGGFSVETEVGDGRTGADLLWSIKR